MAYYDVSKTFLARNLLKEDGVIFISIDDDEVKNLKIICDEIFGEENFIAQLNIVTGANQSGDGVLIQKNVEWCFVYAKSIIDTKIIKVDKTDESLRNLNDAPTPLETRDEMGYSIYYNSQTNDLIPLKDYDKEKIHLNTEEDVYETNQDLIARGYVAIRPGFRNNKLHRWRWGIDTFLERKDEIVVKENNNGTYSVFFQQSGFNAPKNIHNYSVGTLEIKNLFDDIKLFEYPKSTKFIKYLTSISSSENDVVLDFFAGSGTTAHAVMALNAEDSGNRKFISVQLPEHLDKKNQKEAIDFLNSIDKPTNIAEITKERIRRAGTKIKQDYPDTTIDTGFKVFKLSESNFKKWDENITTKEQLKESLDLFANNVKDGANSLDMLYEVILSKGLSLNSAIDEVTIGGKSMYKVNSDGVELLACFEDEISKEALEAVVNLRPIYFICLDSSFKSDTSLKTNSVLNFKDADILFETV